MAGVNFEPLLQGRVDRRFSPLVKVRPLDRDGPFHKAQADNPRVGVGLRLRAVETKQNCQGDSYNRYQAACQLRFHGEPPRPVGIVGAPARILQLYRRDSEGKGCGRAW